MDHHRADRSVDRTAFLHKLLWIIAFVGIGAGFAYYAYWRPMDFRVYHFGARGVFDGIRPVYGAASGLGWPMHYRYPPLFLLLFAPFAMMPLGVGAAVWAALKVMVLEEGLRRFRNSDFGFRNSEPAPQIRNPNSEFRNLLIPCLLAGPYIIEEFRYGNVQFFIFALTAASLLIARSKPLLAAASLALAISIKVWPLFFFPYLMLRGQWKVVGSAACFAVLLTLAPAAYFGFGGNLDLLQQWFAQEFQTQLGQNEIWFPNQSLRGVLMRYLTVVDYSQLPDSNYPLVHIAALSPPLVRAIWVVLAGGIYAGFLVLVHRRRHSDPLLEIAIGFCLLALLQPFTQKYALGVLLFPAIVAGGIARNGVVRILLFISAALVLIQPLGPGSAVQRLLQILGFDFFATVFLTAALTFTWFKFPDPSSYVHTTENRIAQAAMHEGPIANR